MEAKQYATKQPMNPWINLRINEKINWKKWKHNNSKPYGMKQKQF